MFKRFTFALALSTSSATVIAGGAAAPAAHAPSSAPAATEAHAPAKAKTPAAAKKPQGLDFSVYYRSFVEQRGLAAKGEICIRNSSCISDESDYLKYAENAFKIQKGIEAHAKAGNLEAAYYAGKIAFEEAKRFDEEYQIYASFKDERYRDAGRRFLENFEREIRRAKTFLYPAAYAQRPESCMLLGDVLEYDKLGEQKTSALVYYYCASREYFIRGDRDMSVRAYTQMLKSGHPQDPMVIEMHAKLFNQQPANPWRALTPELRAQGFPAAPAATAAGRDAHH